MKSRIKISAIVCLAIVATSFIIAKADEGDVIEKTMVPVQDGIKIFIGDSVYTTNNDSVLCTSVIRGGLISAMENDFEFRGMKLERNHPNRGIFQDAAERYFNDVKIKYIRTPKGSIINDKQSDINEYGAPNDRKLIKKENGNFELVLIWGDKEHTYNEYGKRIY